MKRSIYFCTATASASTFFDTASTYLSRSSVEMGFPFSVVQYVTEARMPALYSSAEKPLYSLRMNCSSA